MAKAWAMVQAAVEYGASAGGGGSMTIPTGVQNVLDWAGVHRLALLVAFAVLVILGFSWSGRRS